MTTRRHDVIVVGGGQAGLALGCRSHAGAAADAGDLARRIAAAAPRRRPVAASTPSIEMETR